MFGIGIQKGDREWGALKGRQTEVACKCWFTSTGRPMPLMVKVKGQDGVIREIREIRVLEHRRRNYAGVPSEEFLCRFGAEGRETDARLIFFPEECRWILKEAPDG